MDTMAIENFISVKETEGPKLVSALEEHVKSYDVDIMNLQTAEELIPGEVLGIRLANGAILKSKSIIIATGARWKELNVPGEKEYRGKGVAYCPHCDGPLFKGKKVAVVGGGNSGVEAAIDLAGIVEHVTLLQYDDQLKADAVLQKKTIQHGQHHRRLPGANPRGHGRGRQGERVGSTLTVRLAVRIVWSWQRCSYRSALSPIPIG